MTVLAKGFRPFFLLAGLFAVLVVPLWLLVFTGVLAPSGPLSGTVWHAHEMIFGFVAAVLAGFLLTAVSNWTGRETATGWGLGALAGLWVAGRVMMATGPGWLASAVDLAFLPVLAGVLARPILATGNRRNAAFPVLLLGLGAANLAVHLDAHGVWPGVAVGAGRAAVHLITVIILVMTGRLVPMFTRNATGAAGIANIRALDWAATLAAGGLALAQMLPGLARAEPVLAAVALAAVLGRTWRWGARHTGRDPLLWVLHAGHAWVAVGFGLEIFARSQPSLRPLAIHALTVGSIGMLTLGVMARVALGHTGRPLKVRPVMGWALGMLGLAALLRVFGPLGAPGSNMAWLWASAGLWSAAFGVFVWVYAPYLVGPRVDGKAG